VLSNENATRSISNDSIGPNVLKNFLLSIEATLADFGTLVLPVPEKNLLILFRIDVSE